MKPLIYKELKRLAQTYLGHEDSDLGLFCTAKAHDIYFRLVEQKVVRCWQYECYRGYFYGVVAQVMRRWLVDQARGRDAAKRGASAPVERHSRNVVAVDTALAELAETDLERSRILELSYFGGFSFDDIAEAVGVSPRTAQRDWEIGRVRLFHQLRGRLE